MKAKDVMTPDVFTVNPDTSVLEAIRLMLQRKISGLPVVDHAGALVGMVTEGDLLRRSELGTERKTWRWIEFLAGPGRGADEYAHAHGRKVRDVMTASVHTVVEHAALSDVLDTMERYHVKRVPVMRGHRLIGIITRSNVLRQLAGLARAARPEQPGDVAIHEALVAELKKQPWAPVGAIEITVKDGVVTFTGAILDDRQRNGLRVAAENTPGVKKVDDQMVWIEPMSGTVLPAPTSNRRGIAFGSCVR
jgi:CBS domain-containing protein